MLSVIWLTVLPTYDILDWTKLKAFADDKLGVAKIIISVNDKVENIMAKRENAGYDVF